MNNGVAFCGSSRCWECGRMVEHRPNGGPQRFHWCRLRWLSRCIWREHQKGWHGGYRFAVEHPDDPMVLADAQDYGSGWAGWMRVGHVEIAVGSD